MRLSETQQGQAWLRLFDNEDTALATRLLDNTVFVSTSEFRRWIAGEIIREAAKGRLALYGEREFPRYSRFFNKLAPGNVRRATGSVGPALIKPPRGSIYIGSEGIVAQLLSELCRRPDVDALLTPGPDRLRPMKTRGPTHRLAIVTDIIGSGNRIVTTLDALWRTESFRSWWAHRKIPIEVLVISYAATEKGLARVRKHRLKPNVLTLKVAPTIYDQADDSETIKTLCRKYDPRPIQEDPGPYGYDNAGTLLAFGHGCPNTTPRMFWAKGRRWTPLFPARSGVEVDVPMERATAAEFADRLTGVNRPHLADPALFARFDVEAREAILLLAAIAHGLRFRERLASRTGIDLPRVDLLLDAFARAGWTTQANVITAAGLDELKAVGRVKRDTSSIPDDRVSVYFPSSLRG
ncbi:hypothetical protein ACETKC_03785 [Brevundimonas intermedia]|nr:hypothetical protein [Brevundimonas intermedia]